MPGTVPPDLTPELSLDFIEAVGKGTTIQFLTEHGYSQGEAVLSVDWIQIARLICGVSKIVCPLVDGYYSFRCTQCGDRT